MKELVYIPLNIVCCQKISLLHYDEKIPQLRKKWWMIELKSANYFLEKHKMLYYTRELSRLQSNNQIYFQFLKLRRCSNESTIPSKRQSLTATNKQVSLAKLFTSSKKVYWSHAQYKIRGKVKKNDLQISTG